MTRVKPPSLHNRDSFNSTQLFREARILMDFAAAAIFSLFLYQGNLEQNTCKKEKCILMTAVQLCDGCLTRRNALRLALRSCDHRWLNMKIDQGPFPLFIVAPSLFEGVPVPYQGSSVSSHWLSCNESAVRECTASPGKLSHFTHAGDSDERCR